MILHELKITNFRQITGVQRFTFAPPGDQPITLILGENGAGKTTLLHACLWCLYGTKDFEHPEQLASYRSLSENKGDVCVSVKLVFYRGSKRFTALRECTFKASDLGSGKSQPFEFTLHETNEIGETRPCPDPELVIQQLLPRELAGFFFFRGEDLEQLVARSGADRLKTAVEEFIDLTVVDNAINHLKKVGKEIEDDLRSSVKGRAKDLSDKIESLEQEIETIEHNCAKFSEEAEKASVQKEDIERELGRTQELQPFITKKKELTEEIDRVTDRIDGFRQQLKQKLSRDGYLAANPQLLAKIEAITKEAVEAGQLPARIKPQFVDDLVGTGRCICGRELGPEENAQLSAWRNGSKLAGIETAIFQVKSSLTSYRNRSTEFDLECKILREMLDESIAERTRLLSERSRNDGRLEGEKGLDNNVGHFQKLLKDTNERLQELSFELGRRDEKIAKASNEIAELRRVREKELKAEDRVELLSRQERSVKNVRDALVRTRESWVGLVQEYLDGQLKSNWSKMAQLERLVRFDEKFTLSIHERGGQGEWVKSAPSAANQRTLALGFVSSLIRLAAEAKDSTNAMGLFSGGDYPLVMDAPFATMDEHFKRTVPAGLLEMVPQLVLISSFDQWEGQIKESLEKKIGKAYVLELHGPEVETKQVKLGKTMVAYKLHEPDAVYDWTEVKEVEA